MLGNGARVRQKLKREYEKALHDLEDSQRLLDQYRETDQPQFTRWLNSHFGALLTEIRELSQKIAADDALILQIESAALFGRISRASAYKRVMEDRENPAPPPRGGNGPEPEAEPFGARPEYENSDPDEDPLEALFEQMFGQFRPGGRPADERGGQARRRPGSPAQTRVVPRLKELYRTLVRRLHPDNQREMTAQKIEWWHQVQTAYEAGDADQLEVILTLCEIGDTGTTAHTSASLLQRITAQLKNSLRQIKRQLAGLRRECAWNFARRADKEVLALQMRRELTQEWQRLRDEWQQTQALLAEWKAAAARGRSPRRRRPRGQPHDLDWVF